MHVLGKKALKAARKQTWDATEHIREALIAIALKEQNEEKKNKVSKDKKD